MSGLASLERGPEKPPFRASCNGCGYCCALQACAVALEYISRDIEGPCPALEFADGKFHCGMVRQPSRYMLLPNNWADGAIGSLFAQMLGIGKGCDADDPTTTPKPRTSI